MGDDERELVSEGRSEDDRLACWIGVVERDDDEEEDEEEGARNLARRDLDRLGSSFEEASSSGGPNILMPDTSDAILDDEPFLAFASIYPSPCSPTTKRGRIRHP